MRAVDVEPHGFFPAELSYLAQGIEAPGRSRAGAAYDGHHLLPLLDGLPVQAVERRKIEPEAIVGGNRDKGLLAQPEDSRRAGHRVVCLVGNQQSRWRPARSPCRHAAPCVAWLRAASSAVRFPSDPPEVGRHRPRGTNRPMYKASV